MLTTRHTLLTLILSASIAFAACGEEEDNGLEGDGLQPAGSSDAGGSSGRGGAPGAGSSNGSAADPQPDDDSDDEPVDASVDATDSCPRLRVVTPGTSLNVRPDPSTAGAPVASLRDGQIVERLDTVTGETVAGENRWYHIKVRSITGYVYGPAAECTLAEIPEPPPGYYLPLRCDTSATVTQGNNTNFSHSGRVRYAFDFGLGTGTPMVAMAAGTISHLYNQTGPGHPCYNGGGQSCINAANYVIVRHADDTQTQYAHLSRVDVQLGQAVARGQTIGLSGSTGWSTGPHAHVERQSICGTPFCSSIPLSFIEAGVPGTGQQVTSANCDP